MKYLALCFATLITLSGRVQADNHSIDALTWLKKMESASHQLTYMGTYVYQQASRVETSKITHFLDENGDHEKLDMLDGPAKETIRLNDDVYCFIPDSNMVKVGKRNTRKFFPALLPKEIDKLTESYNIKMGDMERVAGHECRAVVLEPKDELRYTYKFCGDISSGLLVKATLLNKKNEIVNQFSFTHLNVGGQVDKSKFKPKTMWKKQTWQTDTSVVSGASSNTNEVGWLIKQLPLGFIKTKEMKRVLPGKSMPMTHIVYSDGLTTISIFIEPVAGMEHPMQGLSSQGPVNVFAKLSNEYQITAVGEAPAATVTQFANSIVSTGQ